MLTLALDCTVIGFSLTPPTLTFASEMFDTWDWVENPVAAALPEAAEVCAGALAAAGALVGAFAGALAADGALAEAFAGALPTLAVPEPALDEPPAATELVLVFFVETGPLPPPVVTWADWVLETAALA